jgi:hypothetical protein
MRIPDPEIKEKAISSIEKALESGKSPDNSTQLTLFYYPFAEGKKG